MRSSFSDRQVTAKENASQSGYAFGGIPPALLCGRKSRVLLHANYRAPIIHRQVPYIILVQGWNAVELPRDT
jgi:hypothetical protein